MSEYEQVIDEIIKHGVVVKVNKIVDDNYIPYERKYVGCVVKLDFSEHDKVFEDKIAELKKEVVNYKQAFEDKCADYGVASELLGKYQRENEALKKRIQELDAIDAMRIDEKRELKQRIAELEDKIGDRDKINRCLREKIEELQKENENLTEEYKVISDFANKQMQKNERLKCDIDKMATSKSEWIDKVVEWQQKCEKLESKETEKPTKINLNDQIKVKLTPLGAEIYYHMFDDTNKKAKKTIIEPHLPKVDEKGYTEFTLWGFINTYGQYIDVGKPNVIDPIDIIACE